MSELVGGAAAAETLGGSAAEAGALMRRAREALGLRIEVLAASLKVSVAKLEALEAGQLESLSDRVFVRALAASVCRNPGYRQLLSRGAVLRYQFSEYKSNRPVAIERFTEADCDLQ